MANKLWSDFYNDVLPELPGVETAVADNAIRNSAIEFCEASRAWKYDPGAVDVDANEPEYTLSYPSGSTPVAITTMWTGDLPVVAKSPDELATTYINWRTVEGTSPQYYTQEQPTTFRLVPIPTVSIIEGVTLLIALKPTRAATGLPQWVYEQFMEPIAAGAKMRLMRQPLKPYTNAKMAEHYGALFYDGIKDARISVVKGYARANLQVKFRKV